MKSLQIKKPRQLRLLPSSYRAHGGVLRSKRKGRSTRPLASQKTIHVVMRSSHATREKSFNRHHGLIKFLIEAQARRAQVRVIAWANVGNHLHLHIQLPRVFRESYMRFIRGLTGVIALKIQNASKKNRVVHKPEDRFWDLRPFTRVLNSWREFKNLKHYILLNHFEGLGFERNEADVRAHVKAFYSG